MLFLVGLCLSSVSSWSMWHLLIINLFLLVALPMFKLHLYRPSVYLCVDLCNFCCKLLRNARDNFLKCTCYLTKMDSWFCPYCYFSILAILCLQFWFSGSFFLSLFKLAPVTVSWQGRLLARAGDYVAAADVFQKILELWYAYIFNLMNTFCCRSVLLYICIFSFFLRKLVTSYICLSLHLSNIVWAFIYWKNK